MPLLPVTIEFSLDDKVGGRNASMDTEVNMVSLDVSIDAQSESIDIEGGVTITGSSTAGTPTGGQAVIVKNNSNSVITFEDLGNSEIVMDTNTGIYYPHPRTPSKDRNKDTQIIVRSSNASDYKHKATRFQDPNIVISYNNATFDSGSLGEHLVAQLEPMLVGVTPDDVLAHGLYEAGIVVDEFNPAATLNASRFYSSIDLSGMSFQFFRNEGWHPNGNAMMVNGRFALGPDHYIPATGAECTWQRRDLSFQKSTCLERKTIGDINLMYFSDIITDVSNFKVIPTGFYTDYVPASKSRGIDTEYGAEGLVPCMHLGVHKVDGSVISTTGSFAVLYGRHNINTGKDGSFVCGIDSLKDFSRAGFLGGDSGSPCVFIINGEAVLAGGAETVGESSSYEPYIAEINAAMVEMANRLDPTDPLKDSYVLDHPDLSSFTIY